MRKIGLLLVSGLVLGSCTRDVNLARDVDLPSTKPGLDQVMQQQINGAQPRAPQQQARQAIPQPVEATQPPATPQATPAPATPGPAAVSEPATVIAKKEDVTVTVTTAKGVITLKLYQSKAPNTVNNFLTKAKAGFYNNLTFHRVESWVIQGGDPKGNGTGGGTIPTELNQEPFKVGSLGVARGGDIKVSNDSQFFICTDDCSWLTGQYTNFGEVVSGMDVAKQIAVGDKIVSIVE